MSDETIIRLIGVYDADGTLRGELSYWVGARLGSVHCALCDITHGSLREKPEWRRCRAEFAVPFDTYHRNDQPDAVRSALDDLVPVVAAETSSGIVVLLGPTQLDDLDGDPQRLAAAILQTVCALQLRWPCDR